MAIFVLAEKEISVAGADAGNVSICLLNLDHVIAIFPAIAIDDSKMCVAQLIDGSTADIPQPFEFIKNEVEKSRAAAAMDAARRAEAKHSL